jgi:hypothetical protein
MLELNPLALSFKREPVPSESRPEAATMPTGEVLLITHESSGAGAAVIDFTPQGVENALRTLGVAIALAGGDANA